MMTAQAVQMPYVSCHASAGLKLNWDGARPCLQVARMEIVGCALAEIVAAVRCECIKVPGLAARCSSSYLCFRYNAYCGSISRAPSAAVIQERLKTAPDSLQRSTARRSQRMGSRQSA